MRLLHSLVLLSAGSALPILGFALLASGFVVQGESENLVNTAKARNRATLAAVDAELRGAIGTLQAISSTPSLGAGDFEEFHRYARTVLASQPSWQNVVLNDRDGRQLVNARLPWGTSLPQQPVERPSFDAAVSKRQPVVGDMSFAPRLNNEPGIAVRVPVALGPEVTHVLTAVLSATSFQQLLATQGLPSDWVTGRLVARVPPTEPGKQAADVYLRNVRTAAEGWFRGKTLEGRDSFTAYSTSPLTGWSVGYAIPAEAVLVGATRALPGSWQERPTNLGAPCDPASLRRRLIGSGCRYLASKLRRAQHRDAGGGRQPASHPVLSKSPSTPGIPTRCAAARRIDPDATKFGGGVSTNPRPA